MNRSCDLNVLDSNLFIFLRPVHMLPIESANPRGLAHTCLRRNVVFEKPSPELVSMYSEFPNTDLERLN